MIRRSSPFFDKAMNRQWIEGRDRQVKLEEDDPEIFNIYIAWLYCSVSLPPRLQLDVDDDSMETWNAPNNIRGLFGRWNGNILKWEFSGHDEDVYKKALEARSRVKAERRRLHDERFLCLTKAYILGEKLLDNRFRNAIVDEFVSEVDLPDPVTEETYVPTNWCVRVMYDNTPESSRGRSLMVGIWQTRILEPWSYENMTTKGENLDRTLPKEFLLELCGILQTMSMRDREELRRELGDDIKYLGMLNAGAYYIYNVRNWRFSIE